MEETHVDSGLQSKSLYSDIPVPLLNRGTGRERGSGGGAKPVQKPVEKPVEKPSAARFAHPLRGAKPVQKPGKKPGKKPSAARFAHPLRGAEVLVAVRGPSPGEGGGKNSCVPLEV